MRKPTNFINVFLLLEQNQNYLLYLRNHTGYDDGLFSLVSGHVEPNENAKLAMKREAHEEIGIQIQQKHLKLVHVMHRKTDRENIDLFMKCLHWDGKITNKEPKKCSQLIFRPTNNLPKNICPYIVTVFNNLKKRKLYSEFGW
jgi:8-oxo-dGTP pyrophosphatase MutT (NUDIX family)